MSHSMLEARAREAADGLSRELPGAVIVVAPDGLILSWNDAAKALFGYSSAAVVGRSILDTIVPPEHVEENRQWLEAATQAGSAMYESVRCREDGRRLWVDVGLKLVKQGQDGVTLVVMSERDITRVKYRREVEVLQARFQGLLEAVPDATLLVDSCGRIALVNSEAERLFGYRRHELLGELVEVLVPARFRGNHPGHRADYFADLRARPMGRGLELAGRRKDGTEFPVEIGLSPFSTEEGTLAIAAVRDITARKRTEAKYRDLLEAAPDAMVIVNRQGLITLINSQTERLFGHSREELLGKPIELLVPAALRELHASHRDRYLDDPHRRPMGSGLELSGHRKDGSEFPVEISLSPVATEEGMLVTAAVRDITERRRLEEIRREVNERRAAEEALTRHAAELARSNADLEQFAYVASHDLQEPLRMVANYARLLAQRYRGRLDPDADQFIGYVVDGASRMHQLITDLLAYSRVGTKGNPFGAIDCEVVFARVLGDLKLAIEQAGAVVTHDTLPTVLGDGVQLGQLFQNLLGNAIKFRGAQPCRVHVRAERNGREWTFAVCDNGIGIAPEHATRIFLIFQRLHSAAEYPGTGIGLAISKKIVERHDGRIWVDSYPGVGATFCFTIPAAPQASHERRGAACST
jgi:PAS domain S-box-containing protein